MPVNRKAKACNAIKGSILGRHRVAAIVAFVTCASSIGCAVLDGWRNGVVDDAESRLMEHHALANVGIAGWQ
ncbi:hypothetical protein HSBAA_20590 [Vreelandella sulfidaeris]|uniref:Uncharacterized protein n=1 Tax=Vreelandella sulfidaeris TaxID=115553 RepID=A0A455U6C5_9GAMM|nr:hypothetical protein HSBAA_20590 [Halomonas sulfidaeris]